MPLITIHLPKNAFSKQQKQDFAKLATQTLLKLEGMEKNSKAQNLSWVEFMPFADEDFFMAGHPTDKPHYRMEVSVFKGTLNDERKQQLTEQLTRLILELEGSNQNILNAARVWVMITEIEDGNWGGAGQIYRIKDLMKMMQ